MKLGYIRVSTDEQNTDRQLSNIKPDLDYVFEEKMSGKNTERPELQRMLSFIGTCQSANIEVYIHSIDRLARSLIDLMELMELMTSKGAKVYFVSENMTFDRNTNNPQQTFIFTILASFAQFERAIMKERQREGIEKAKIRGAYRKNRKGKLSDKERAEIKAKIDEGLSPATIRRQHGISYTTLYKIRDGISKKDFKKK